MVIKDEEESFPICWSIYNFDFVFPEPVRKTENQQNPTSIIKDIIPQKIITVSDNCQNNEKLYIGKSIPPDKLHDEISKLKSKINRTLLYIAFTSLVIFIVNSKILLAGDIIPYIHLNSNHPIHKSFILAIGSISILYFWSQIYMNANKTKNCFRKLENSNQEYLDISGFYDPNTNIIERIYYYFAILITIPAVSQSIVEIPVLINLLINQPIMPEDWVPVIERSQ